MRELTLPGRMILLPGFGCDGRIFGPQRTAFGDRLETPDWAPHKPGESLRHYAERWAKQLSRPGDDTPLALGGLSMGGVVAQEMIRSIQPTPRAVLLIASARRADHWSLCVQVAQALSRVVPAASAGKVAAMLALPFALRDGLDDRGKKLLRQMARDMDPRLIKWMVSAVADWPGPPAPTPADPPVYQVHGEKDWMIHPGPQVDTLIEGARHVINLSHTTTVNRFLFEKFLAHVPEAQVESPRVEDPDLTARRRLILEGAPAGTPMV